MLFYVTMMMTNDVEHQKFSCWPYLLSPLLFGGGENFIEI